MHTHVFVLSCVLYSGSMSQWDCSHCTYMTFPCGLHCVPYCSLHRVLDEDFLHSERSPSRHGFPSRPLAGRSLVLTGGGGNQANV